MTPEEQHLKLSSGLHTHIQPMCKHTHTLRHTQELVVGKGNIKIYSKHRSRESSSSWGHEESSMAKKKKVASEVALHKGASYLLTCRIRAGGVVFCAGGAKRNVTTRSPAVAKQAFVTFSFSTLPRWMVPRPDRFQPSLRQMRHFMIG